MLEAKVGTRLRRALGATALLVALPAFGSAPPQPRDAHAVIERMLAQAPALQSYRARVHVNVHMLNFPYLSPQLDGTSYYKRAEGYAVVFDTVPFYMRGFSKLFDNMGNPAAWETDQTVSLLGERMQDGRSYLVLRMKKKIHSDILEYADAFVDVSTYRLTRMEWHYTSGGSIVMTESYRMNDGFALPSLQHAYVNIPHVRAVGDAVYAEYQVNVPVSSGVFGSSS